MADEECMARAELRAVLESGEPGHPEQWRVAFSSSEEMVAWAGQHHPNLLARTLFAAVGELAASFKKQCEIEATWGETRHSGRRGSRGPERSGGRGRSAPAKRSPN